LYRAAPREDVREDGARGLPLDGSRLVFVDAEPQQVGDFVAFGGRAFLGSRVA
jgi:hypothetical protein